MSGTVDKLELGGGLTSLTSQITKVKGPKTSKLNLLKKAIDRFEEDRNNLEIWKNVHVTKDKADDCGEAFWMLTEAILEAMRVKLGAWSGEADCPLKVRFGVALVELKTYESDKQKIDFKYFWLASGMQDRESYVLVSNVKANVRKVKPADTVKPGCAALKVPQSQLQEWAGKARGWIQESNFMIAEINVYYHYLNAILDRKVHQKGEALPEYAARTLLKSSGWWRGSMTLHTHCL